MRPTSSRRFAGRVIVASEVKLPRLGQGMESGTIVKWLKSEGDSVEKGEPLYELDTDKVTQEVEADFSGVLLKIAVSEGEVPVGRTIAVIGEQGEDVPAISDEAETPSREEPQEAPAPSQGNGRPQEPAAVQPSGGRGKASPLCRRVARERGVGLPAPRGTRPEGRNLAADVGPGQAAAAPAP